MRDYGPYKGLVPFTEKDSEYFFGRDRERRAISAALRGSRLTVLYGESGVGKSSVLSAGVAVDLLQDPDFALILFRSWHFDPTGALADEIAKLTKASGSRSNGSKLSGTEQRKSRLRALLDAWEELDGRTLLIVLDQFEEYFQYHSDHKNGDTLAGQLPDLLNRPDAPVNFLFSVREDALSTLDRFKGAIPGLFDNLVRVEHLSRRAAQDAITKPLDKFNREIREGRLVNGTRLQEIHMDPRLAARVVDEVVSAQDTEQAGVQASYLQLVMTRWWRQEISDNSREFRVATLERLGGIKRIVGQYLEDTLTTMSPEQQRLAAAAFEFMVTHGGRKIAQSVSELSNNASVRDQSTRTTLQRVPETLNQIVDTLQRARLLAPVPPPRGSRTGESYFEFAHDVVAKAAFEWRNSFQRAQELLKTKRRLRRAAVTIAALAVLSIGLIVSAVWAWLNARKATETSLREKSESVPTLLAVHPAEGLLIALETTAESWRSLGKVPPIIQANLKDAVEMSRERVVIPSPGGPVVGLAMSPDGQLLAFNSGDGRIHFWDLKSQGGQQSLAGIPDLPSAQESQQSIQGPTSVVNPENPANPLSISPDGKLILTSYENGRRLGFARRDGKNTKIFEASHTNRIVSALFRPDGKRIVSAGVDGEIRIWDNQGKPLTKSISLQEGAEVYSASVTGELIALARGKKGISIRNWEGESVCELPALAGGALISVAFSSRTGTLVAGSSDGKVAVLRSPCNSEPKTMPAHTAAVTSIAFHPDGERFATGSLDHTVRIWDINGREIGPALLGHEAGVQAVVFHPSGKFLVSASAARPNETLDNSVRVWDTDGGLLTASANLEQPGLAVAFSHDGALIATATSANSPVRLWTTSGLALGPPLNFQEPVNIFALSFRQNDFSLVGAGLRNGKVVRFTWDLKNPSPVSQELRKTGPSPQLMLDRGGNSVYIGDASGALQRWPWGEATATPLPARFDGPIEALAVSSDGKAVLFGAETRQIEFWLGGNKRSVNLPHRVTDGVDALAFRADGRQLAVAGRDRTIVVSDITGQVRGPASVRHKNTVSGLVFSPDGHTIASSSLDGTVRLWDSDANPLGAPLQDNVSAVQAIAFSPDGSRLASVGDDHQLRIWRSDWQAWFEAGCRLVAQHAVFRTQEDRAVKIISQVCDSLRVPQSIEDLNSDRALIDNTSHVLTAYLQRTGETPLHLASGSGLIETIQTLLARGADPAQRDSSGRTAVQCAAAAGHPEVANYLLERFPDLLTASNASEPEPYSPIREQRMPKDPSPEIRLARAYETGNGQEQSLDLAAKYYRAAAEKGDAFGEYAYGWMLYFGTPSQPRSLPESYRWLSRAAEQHQPAALNFLAVDFENGAGGFYQDGERAAALFLRSTELGDEGAVDNLCNMYADKKVEGGSDQDAASWCTKGAALDETISMHRLGWLYLEGRGVAQSYGKAAELFRRNAEKESGSAVTLGWLYETGLGVTRSDAEAAKWYLSAAKQDNPQGQIRLGRMYEEGSTVNKSLSQAIYWYRKAADQKDDEATAQEAKENLKRLGQKVD